jgi:hypothetical protein
MLAALDAMAWPLICWRVLSRLPGSHGLLVPSLLALLVLFTLRRLHIALRRNSRYRFTTWKAGRLMLALAVISCALRSIVG